MKRRKDDMVWVVVLVESGIPIEAQVYRDWRAAKRKERSWRKQMDDTYDATGIFEVNIETKSSIPIKF